jgi:hypothetical protein
MFVQEVLEDNKGAIGILKSKKGRQHSGRKKQTTIKIQDYS